MVSNLSDLVTTDETLSSDKLEIKANRIDGIFNEKCLNDHDSHESSEPHLIDINDLDVEVTDLYSWFQNYRHALGDVKIINIDVRDVLTNETIMFTIQDPSKQIISRTIDSDVRVYKRIIKVFNEANKIKVLNVEPMFFFNEEDQLMVEPFKVFNNNSFRTIQKNRNSDVIFKCYVDKSKMITILCVDVDGLLIPYYREKIRSPNIQINKILNEEYVKNILDSDIDCDLLKIKYPQSEKHISSFRTTHQAIKWLIDRQSTIIDISHHLQIDDAVAALIGIDL